MEGSDRLMLRDMFEVFRPGAQLSMKEEYHEKFADGLKAEIPELFPTVRTIEDVREGIFFKGPKTKLTFPGVRDVDILIFDLRDDGWNVMPRRRHVEIENKVMNILRKLYREKGQGARNARLFRAITGIPGGPVGEISGYLTGYKGKNAEQQGDLAAEEAGIQSAFPNRKRYSGRRKTVRRKNLRSSRKNK